MRRLSSCSLACLLSALFPLFSYAATEPATITQDELVRREQQMYDALPAGDTKPWAAYYADDAIIYDEKGHTFDKKGLLAENGPLPPGYGGIIKVVNAHTIFAPGVATLGYECTEIETVFGQVLHARYHSVDTWLYRNGRWQIASAQTMRYYEDPALGVTDTAHLDDFVGTYQLSPDNIRTVFREGNNLFTQRVKGAKTQLLPESGDLFFRTGIEGRMLFHRDSSGKVDAIYDRRNNEDIVWKRTQ